ncbi:MAG: protease modulator HflC [archaeon]
MSELTDKLFSVTNWVKGALGAAALLAVINSPYVVDQTEQAVITQMGKPVRVILNPMDKEERKEHIDALKEKYVKEGKSVAEGPGLYFKLPFFQQVHKFDRRLMRWDGFPEEIVTVDKKYIWVDTTARWSIDDPLTFLNSVGSIAQGHARLDDAIDSITRNKLTKRDVVSIVRTSNREMKAVDKELSQGADYGRVKDGRDVIVDEISNASAEACEQYGIGIKKHGVLIKGLNYVESVQQSVMERMKSERERIAQKYISEGDGEFKSIMGDKEVKLKEIESGAYRTAREKEGAAEAEATRIYSEAFNRDPDFYRFTRTLELYKSSMGTNTTLILGTGNPLMNYLSGKPEVKSSK